MLLIANVQPRARRPLFIDLSRDAHTIVPIQNRTVKNALYGSANTFIVEHLKKPCNNNCSFYNTFVAKALN